MRSRVEFGLRGGEGSRTARAAGSRVSLLACSRKAAAAAYPPRRFARSAERSRSSATASSGPSAACSAMPGTTIGIGLTVGHVRERAMNAPTVCHRGRAVGRGANERMTEADASAEFHQAGFLGGRFCGSSEPKLPGGTPQQYHVADRVGRRHQQQSLCVRRKRLDSADETLLDLACNRPGVRKFEPACQLSGIQAPRELEHRQWVAPGLGDDPFAHSLIEPPRDHRLQQALAHHRSPGLRSRVAEGRAARPHRSAPALRTPSATDSARRRRETNAKSCADTRSSH